jgi:hypothetical protein
MTAGRIDYFPRVASPDFAFVGRRREMATLAAALEQARAGVGSIVFLSGEAGTGKTLLVSEFSAFARTRGAKIFGGRASVRFRDALPFGLWNEILSEQRSAAAGPKSPPINTASALVSADRRPPSSEHRSKAELLETTARALVEYARTLIVDDLYAVNPLSLSQCRRYP